MAAMWRLQGDKATRGIWGPKYGLFLDARLWDELGTRMEWFVQQEPSKPKHHTLGTRSLLIETSRVGSVGLRYGGN